MPEIARDPTRFVSYLRVSTDKQGRSGLGIEAQRDAVARHLEAAGKGAKLLAEYVEVESGSRSDRPQLDKALEHAALSGAVLIIAKLDRLSRDAFFLLGLQKAGVKFLAADMPEANEMVVGFMAILAEAELKRISQRTKDALAAAKKRGVKLGNPNGAAALAGRGNDEAVSAIKTKADETAKRYRNTLAAIRKEGITSARGIAAALNDRGVLTPRGRQWDAKGVTRLQDRLAGMANA